MHNQIFVNLPVKDLKRSVDFFTKLGYTFNPQFTDEQATCMILGDNLFVMLLVEKYSSVSSIAKIESLKTMQEAFSSLNWGFLPNPSFS